MVEFKKNRIAIAGIGGIGGYIGGKLAGFYSGNENVEIIFIARGEMAAAIEKSGLLLQSNNYSQICKPALISEDPLEIGAVDVLIICTKNYAVLDIVKKYNRCLNQNSTIITIQNIVNGKETINPYLPESTTLLEGCIYIASNIVRPGQIKHVSGPAKLLFGSGEIDCSSGKEIANILANAGIDATYVSNIESVLWKKFLFVSPTAIVTALFQITFGEILENAKFKNLYINLILELMHLARAKKIPIDENTVLNNIKILGDFDSHVKSSFQIDIENNNPSEINSLVKYVVVEAKLLQIPTPYFSNALKQIAKNLKVQTSK